MGQNYCWPRRNAFAGRLSESGEMLPKIPNYRNSVQDFRGGVRTGDGWHGNRNQDSRQLDREVGLPTCELMAEGIVAPHFISQPVFWVVLGIQALGLVSIVLAQVGGAGQRRCQAGFLVNMALVALATVFTLSFDRGLSLSCGTTFCLMAVGATFESSASTA